MEHFTSDQFTWKNGRGIANMSDLFGDDWKNIDRFTIQSTRTGAIRTFEMDTEASGYEDGWDGEYKVFAAVYTDNLWDGTRVTIMNY